MFKYIWLIMIGIVEFIGWASCAIDFVATVKRNAVHIKHDSVVREHLEEFTKGWTICHVVIISVTVFILSIYSYLGG